MEDLNMGLNFGKFCRSSLAAEKGLKEPVAILGRKNKIQTFPPKSFLKFARDLGDTHYMYVRTYTIITTPLTLNRVFVEILGRRAPINTVQYSLRCPLQLEWGRTFDSSCSATRVQSLPHRINLVNLIFSKVSSEC